MIILSFLGFFNTFLGFLAVSLPSIPLGILVLVLGLSLSDVKDLLVFSLTTSNFLSVSGVKYANAV